MTRWAGKSVVLFRTPDAADDDVEALSRLIGQGGGTVTGTVSLTQEFVDANSAEKLLSVVNSPIVPAGTQLKTTSVDQGSQAGDLLGIALLTTGKPEAPAVDDMSRDTVLAALRDTGFLTYGDRARRRRQRGGDRHRRRAGRRRGQPGRHRRAIRGGPGATRVGHRAGRPRRLGIGHRIGGGDQEQTPRCPRR